MWDKMKNINEWNVKVKMAKLQVYRMQLDSLRMNNDKDITKFFIRVDEIVNVMMGQDERIKDYNSSKSI